MVKFPDVSPELDTVRVAFPCWSFCNIKAFFEYQPSEIIRVVSWSEDVGYHTKWEKIRQDHKKSSWCTMQIIHDTLRYGMKQQFSVECITFEYSVAKWHIPTNGINRGVPASAQSILQPIADYLKVSGIEHFCIDNMTIDQVVYQFYQRAILRRCDLSYNFQLVGCEVSDIMTQLQLCSVNGQKVEDFGKSEGKKETVSWGGGLTSNYKVMFYDKKKEQQKTLNKRSNFITIEDYKKHREFWTKYQDCFNNVVRFEVQFKSKFFINHFGNDYKDKKGLDFMENIINLCVESWGDLLRKIDKQLGTLNHHTPEEYNIHEYALKKLDFLRINGTLSRAKYSNLVTFLRDCHEKGWKNTRNEFNSRSSFSMKRKELIDLIDFDVKQQCAEKLPIMRIM